MKLKVNRYSMQIEPENDVEVAYLEEVIGLHEDGDCAIARRVSVMGLPGVFAHLVIERDDAQRAAEEEKCLTSNEK